MDKAKDKRTGKDKVRARTAASSMAAARADGVRAAARARESAAETNGGTYGNQYSGGGANGTTYGNLDTGNNTPRGGSPVQPDNSPIPSQRAYDDTLRELNQLRQAVRDDPESAKQVQDLIQEMARLDPSRFPGNPALVEQLHSQVLADVDKLELQLRRQLDDKEAGQVRSGDTKNVPQGYEESVAEYYRRLSKNSKSSQ